ncbi:dihydroxyacetone kinase subunit L [Haloferax mediterranei ATCC 33500]|uniref:Dihydroxyacetone kinase n=1 Tax=Haloferax mediterranei (strain ATCC 33500 / DSM 1411 / JCM 8866 / NBRC 14739 / NCIMB 2177 / R-4) TaxID=523841 RepID=I3R502_HALMT|nr:dihydroxyacetone kinase subunit DhaL [Haloferax mediterranei]AFK19312.1 dihydroxyacetone kinase, L subunit [Haloferax mediterranei ATCC 33500]AHZ21331.1 dihydroxyacetone kinase [Haloferax mediterranei ATCC 33500]EMA04499.1 dihydroxyacetone kinase subunit DhaL [Haloferax mediterranei ATCC 33500]MDX5989416.1 dihydroxyacetone kinase subunit DhaL [Haloferax mediterranei ATCC 33500]QCQ75780.1 dihydroxyacetone kinase subunit L [Haloferax mediterranei ATCC 33500]
MADVETQRDAVLDALDNVAARLAEEKGYLTDLDSAIGDADHGANMQRGFGEAAEKREAFAEMDPDEVVKNVGTTLISNVGGASGPLYGGSIMFASQELEDGITAETSVAFAEAYLDKVKDRGGAEVGSKTMVDALVPAVHTYKKSIEQDDLPPLTALAKAVDAAERGVEFTVPLKALKGRSSFLDWRSVGHQDPGATSTLFILEELLATAEEYLDGAIDRDAHAGDAARRDE